MTETVISVDEQVSFRQMLAFMLEHDGRYEVVAEVSSGIDALRLCRQLKPHFLILDLALSELSGAEVLRTMRNEFPAPRSIVYTAVTSGHLLQTALQERPHGFVHKKDSLATFQEALRPVEAGCSHVTAYTTSILDEPRAPQSGASSLTPRKRAIVEMITEGYSNKEMGARLSIAPKTVEYHRVRLMEKIGSRDVAGVIRYAYVNDMISVPGREESCIGSLRPLVELSQSPW